MHPQEFSAADSLHSRAVDGQWGVVSGVPPPEVHHNLLCLLHIEGQIVSATAFSQLCHFLSVVCFIVVLMRPTTVVSSANLMMWLELNLAVQSWVRSVKSSGLSTQPCGAPVLSVVLLEVLWPTRLTEVFRLKSPGSNYRGNCLRPSRFSLFMSCCGIIVLNAELKSMNSILT